MTVTAALSGTVTRSADTVVVLRLGGSATKGVDYTATPDPPGIITIPAGQLSATATITITPTQDTAAEGNETIDIVGLLDGFSISGATVNLSDDDSTPPATPAGLKVTRSGSNAARLTWTALSTAPTGYRLQRHAGDGNWVDVADEIGPEDVVSLDRSLDYETTYFYRLVAFNADGDSAPSNVVQITTGRRSTFSPGPRGPTGPVAPPEPDEPTSPTSPTSPTNPASSASRWPWPTSTWIQPRCAKYCEPCAPGSSSGPIPTATALIPKSWPARWRPPNGRCGCGRR